MPAADNKVITYTLAVALVVSLVGWIASQFLAGIQENNAAIQQLIEEISYIKGKLGLPQ